MNKSKKIAFAVVSTVLAGTMVFSLAGCKKKKLEKSEQEVLTVSVDEKGNLKYSADTTLNMNIGDKNYRSISFLSSGNILSGTVKLPDNVDYKAGDLKPAWVAAGKKLGVKFNDVWETESNKLDTYDTNHGDWDIVTDSTDNMTLKGMRNTSYLLDFNNYLDYMPHYKAYLASNPIVRLALTSNTKTGAMYYAPYFDGDNDVEKYTMVKKNWVEALLDKAPTATQTTFKSQAEAKAVNTADGDKQTISGTAAAVTAFMGKEDWSVIGGDGKTTVYVKYSAALKDAKDESTALGGAVKEAAGKAYTGDSGNIVDIQNFVINEKGGDVTGDKLLKVLQEYIKVTYQTKAGAQFYTKLSDVFDGLNAAWDADLMTGLFRCVVTNGHVLNSADGKIGDEGSTPENLLYALAAREKTTQRTMDLVALAGELYGIRGLESRYEYTYVDAKGDLHDARLNAATYEGLAKMSALAKEGLMYFGQASNKATSYYTSGSIEALMMHDYSQTQTSTGGFAVQKDSEGNALRPSKGVEADYNFAPILTAVSKWDTNDDGKTDTIMRFTESWRSIKNSGFCVPYDSVKNNPEKLAAVLAFVDFLFTDDGQIDMTFGPKADNANGDNGFWFNPEATADQIKAGKYFEYGGKKLYSETYYKGKYIPTVTTNTMNLFYGKAVNGSALPTNKNNLDPVGYGANCVIGGSYTDFARQIIGSTVGLGLKHQGFEYQTTAQCGLDGAAIVSEAVVNGAIKHVDTKIVKGNLWYTEVPTAFPLTTNQSAWVKTECQTLKSTIFVNSSKTNRNLAIYVMFNGINPEIELVSGGQKLPGTAAEIVTLVSDTYNLGTYETYVQLAWESAMELYNVIK